MMVWEVNTVENLFEKISETITSKSKDIAKKAKDLVDVNTVKSNITEQKKIIRRTYASIGEQYYKDHISLGEHEYEVEFEIIGEANAKLKELYEELNSLKKVRVCPECGANVAMDSVFCNKCGTKLPEVQEPADVCDAEEARSEDDVEVESVICGQEDEVEDIEAEDTEATDTEDYEHETENV